jgi:hypothetical protein
MPIEKINPKVPVGLAEIVRKGMAKQRDQRFSRCAQMLEAIEQFEAGGTAPTMASPTGDFSLPRSQQHAGGAADSSPPALAEPAAAAGSDPLAQAIGYFCGTIGKVDTDSARELFPQAAGSGNVVAKMWLAILHHQGLCGFKCEPKLGEMIAATVIDSVFDLGEKGDPEAAFVLGEAYYFGLAVPADPSLAFEWYEWAAQKGNPMAMNSLGYMYLAGEGAPRDSTQAARMYQAAAQKGHAQAMKSLGYLYANGDGVPHNVGTAIEWWKKSARLGLVEAQEELTARNVAW